MINLLHQDCMEFMATCHDNQFDLAIVDPPYGIGGHEGNNHWVRKKFSDKGKQWDDCIPNKEYFIELFRVSKNQIIWGGNYFTEFLPPSMGWIFWFKTIECVGRCFSEGELAFTSFDVALRVAEYKPFQRNGSRIHPTQKPIQLYQWILKNYAKEGDKIFDSHLGSGSSAIAAHQLGFDFTGTEIDLEYFNAMNKRFDLITSQTQLTFA